MDSKTTRAVKRLLLLFFLAAVGTRAQNVPYSDIVISAAGRPIAGAGVSVCSSPGLATTAAAVSSNLVTLTMASNPITAGFAANMTLQVSGFTGADTYLNGGTLSGGVITGGFTILSVTSTTIVYQLSHANASATSNGFAFQQGNISTSCAPLAAITSDQAGLSPITQPGFSSDNLGNYAFFAPVNAYLLQYGGQGILVRIKPITLSCFGGATNCTVTGAVSIAAPGSLTITGNLTSTTHDNVLEVSSFATGGTGTQASPWTSSSGTGGFNEAIVSAGTAIGGNARLHAKAGYYSITTCINATANGPAQQGNSAPPSPLTMQGDGRGKTNLIGTSGGCFFDTTGRVVRITDMTMTEGASTPSTLGILQARTNTGASQFVSNSLIDNVVIDLPSVSGANGGNGTIGVYCYSCEQSRYLNNTISANHPYVITSNNIFSLSSAYQTFNTTIRFVSQNEIKAGSCTLYADATYSAGECILLQGHAANTGINHVAGECNGANVSSSNPFLRIKAPTAPDGAGDPLPGLLLTNLQPECVASGALLIDEQVLTNAVIQGNIKNASTVPIILLTTANSSFIDPFISVQIANAAVTEPMISDGGTATSGITGGTLFLGATSTISFTNAATGCTNVRIYADYSSPTIVCANTALSGNVLIGEVHAPDIYYFKAPGAVTYNSNTSYAWNMQGVQKLGLSLTQLTLGAGQTIGNTALTATMGLTYKPGPGTGNYSSTSTTYAAVDTTNLCAIFTVPTGWKLKIEASGLLASATAAVAQNVALADAGTTCAGGGITPLNGTERIITPPAAGTFDEQFHLQYVLTGDGAAHSVALIFKTSNAADANLIQNSSTSAAPSILYTLMPSN